ncbi:hypothetical protein BCV69DRAFT_284862 [Microstroma glucosiphilum]|uniref:Zn(2)-C6 fungal-type domain-containing protein n=1 Tax=Pseudomicrostroma glucosiphilum TaxID=1684307 RepID=A0A316U121_9BASI|nr:hypothetical protein BCV69DRAFT_284862 [Pseudomicrostroma glucosiphilum]PWN18558.1 hypothetical protein BCV69DRAFT_284862 [Pseudomicrostroma glucosiphilum]
MTGRPGYPPPHLGPQQQQQQQQQQHHYQHHEQHYPPQNQYQHPHFQAQQGHPSYHHPSNAIAIHAGSSPSGSHTGTSPNSVGGGPKAGKTGTKSKRPRPYASKTCSECRRRKIACVASDPDPDVCKRCYKMKLHCTLSEENARGDGRRRKRGKKRSAEDGGDDDDDEDEDGQGETPRSGTSKRNNDQSGDESDEEEDGNQDTAQSYGPPAPAVKGPTVGRRPSATNIAKGSRGLSTALPPPAPLPAHLASGNADENAPDTDFLYSMKEDKDRARILPPLSHIEEKRPGTKGGRHAAATGEVAPSSGSGSGRMILGVSSAPSKAAQRAAAQNVMLVHGCPVWVYSDLMARFNLLNISDKGSRGGGMVPRLDAAELCSKLTSLPANVINTIDDILEDARLTMPHIPLLCNLIVQQEERYDSARSLLIAILVYVASNEGDLTSTLNPLLPLSVHADLKSFLSNQALDSIMFSPMKSREIVIAAEILAVYDPLLGHPAAGKLETSRFLLPTSFYLDLAIGFAYRIGVGDSVHELQQWYLDDVSKAAKSGGSEAGAEKPLPDHIASALHDATIWASLELHISELNRNLQGATNCFAKDWKPLWPHQASPTSSRRSTVSPKALPSFATILQHCSKRIPGRKIGVPVSKSTKKGFSIASRLGMVNLAFRQDGLGLIQDILATLYHGIPDVEKIDRCYMQLEDDLTGKLRAFADKSLAQVLATSKVDPPSSDLLALSKDIFERESAWMRHFYGGYCFAILLWLPNLQKSGKAGSSAKAGGGKGDKDEGGKDLHEHGIHDVDMAASVINTIKGQKSDPDHMMKSAAESLSGKSSRDKELLSALANGSSAIAGAAPTGDAAAGGASPDMSSFHFLVKHNESHELVLQRWLTLSLETLARLRCSNIHRIPTNSRMVYVSKEIIENHATRKRGWGKVGDNAVIHTGLMNRACEHFKQKGNALDNSLAKLTKILEKILDGWRKIKPPEQNAPPATQKKRDSQSARGTAPSAASFRKGSTSGPAISAVRTQQQQQPPQSSTGASSTLSSMGSGGTVQSEPPLFSSHMSQHPQQRYQATYSQAPGQTGGYNGLGSSSSANYGPPQNLPPHQYGSPGTGSGPYQGSYGGGAGPGANAYGAAGSNVPAYSNFPVGSDSYNSGAGGGGAGSYYSQPHHGHPPHQSQNRASFSSAMGGPMSSSASSPTTSQYAGGPYAQQQPQALPSPSVYGSHGAGSALLPSSSSTGSNGYAGMSTYGQQGLPGTNASLLAATSPNGSSTTNGNGNGNAFDPSNSSTANLNLLDLDIFTDAPLDLNVENLFFDNWPQMDMDVDMSSLFQKQ